VGGGGVKSAFSRIIKWNDKKFALSVRYGGLRAVGGRGSDSRGVVFVWVV